jgi:hypothetical protein
MEYQASSPDGQWQLKSCLGELSLDHRYFQIVNIGDGRQWFVNNNQGKPDGNRLFFPMR